MRLATCCASQEEALDLPLQPGNPPRPLVLVGLSTDGAIPPVLDLEMAGTPCLESCFEGDVVAAAPVILSARLLVPLAESDVLGDAMRAQARS